MSTISQTYDPPTTAANLAENYTAARQAILTNQTKQAAEAATALTALKSALSGYQASLMSLTSGKSMLSQAATFSNTAFGSATASASASAGSYSFFVERLATASQVSFNGLADSAANGGTFAVNLNGAPAFTVDLASADTDASGTITPREVAAAINAVPTNLSRVSAAIVTVNGVAQLILTARDTGEANTITVDAANVGNAGLKASLSAVPNTLVDAQDALVWLGAQGSGTPIAQASNTFSNIDGVKMTFTKAHALGETPLTVTVAADNAGTIANVQGFVDAYNKLKGVIDAMVDPGDPSKKEASGVFAHDAGMAALQSRLIGLLRPAVPGSDSLAAYGVTSARDGTLTLDSARLTRTLATNPNGLDNLIGSASKGAAGGIAGNLDVYLKQWTSSVDGQILERQEGNGKLQSTLAQRQDQLDSQYNSAYDRYLQQFTMLQNLQTQMASNTSLFDALFGDDSK